MRTVEGVRLQDAPSARTPSLSFKKGVFHAQTQTVFYARPILTAFIANRITSYLIINVIPVYPIVKHVLLQINAYYVLQIISSQIQRNADKNAPQVSPSSTLL
jgi:hypothetical protein